MREMFQLMPLLDKAVQPDFEAFRRCLLRQEEPRRVFHTELYLDAGIKDAVAQRFQLARDLDPADPFFPLRRDIEIHRFLGYDMIRYHPPFDFWIPTLAARDTAAPEDAEAQRNWVNEHSGPIQSWEDFERYPWLDPEKVDTRGLEWLDKNLPDDMAVYDLTAHILEQTSNLLGYESLCYKIYEDPDLVDAIIQRVGEIYLGYSRLLCQFRCVGVLWGSDDMGFRTQTLLPPDWLKEKILPWHTKAAAIAHESGRLYFLHCCGNIEALMDAFIDDVQIDAKHSFEDTILPPTKAHCRWGGRIAILGGIDVDFLCRHEEPAIRQRVRETLDVCHPGGGYALGTGNSVANYMPLDHYLVMLDEGRRYSG